MTLDALDGTWTWVWKEPPETLDFCHGLIVRAANGNGHTAPEGFNFAANYDAWASRFAGPLIAWTYLYQGSDPALAAEALAASPAVGYIIDWEDAAGPAPSGARFAKMVAELRARRPAVPIGFSSYPTRAQAVAHGVDWDAGIDVCDFVAPQAYYDSQLHDYPQILADAKGRYVQLDLEPRVSTAWGIDAGMHLETGQGVSFWRLGILDAVTRNRIAAFPQGDDVTQAEVEAAVRRVLRINDTLDVPPGQASNDKLFSALLGQAQQQHNAMNSMASAINGLTATLMELVAKVDQLTPGGPGPSPSGAVSGTFTGTISAGGGS